MNSLLSGWCLSATKVHHHRKGVQQPCSKTAWRTQEPANSLFNLGGAIGAEQMDQNRLARSQRYQRHKNKEQRHKCAQEEQHQRGVACVNVQKPKLHLWPSGLELRKTSCERFMPTSDLQGLCTLPWTCLGFTPALTHSSRHHALIRNKQVYQNVFYRCMRSIQVLKYPLPNVGWTEAEQVILSVCVTPLEPRSHKTHTRLKTFVPFWLSAPQKRHDWNTWPHLRVWAILGHPGPLWATLGHPGQYTSAG